MYRLFNTHLIRKEIALPDVWDLRVPGKDEFKIPVPSCVETIPSLANYKGECVISTNKRFEGNCRLIFKGVGFNAEISVDGETLGTHYGAYGEFSFIIKNAEDKEHSVKVKCNNTYSEESTLHIPNDYYSYLGITRPAYIEKINEAYIKWIHITPYFKNGEWKLNAEICVENIEDFDGEYNLKLFITDSDSTVENFLSEISFPIQIKANSETSFNFTLNCPCIEEYKLNNPVMYFAHARLCDKQNKAFDDLIERFGFRETKVVGNKIFFGGEEIKIKGFNRHEDLADFGSSIPLAAMHRDIMLIKDSGANTVRTCHYPNDERFLDLCDEYGILVWEEGHARAINEERMRHKNFLPQSRLSITEMITNHFNHPSIFVWGLLNECVSFNEFGRSCYKELIDLIRSLDPHRPVTFASCHLKRDICLDLVDIVSYNMYPKWYEDEPCYDYIDDCIKYVKTHGGENKPFIVSEIGAGAIYGYRTNTNCIWSEEFQAEALEEQLTACFNHKDVNGVLIWQFADCRVDNTVDWSMRRPKTQNNKGIFDSYRRDKLAYKVVKDIFTK